MRYALRWVFLAAVYGGVLGTVTAGAADPPAGSDAGGEVQAWSHVVPAISSVRFHHGMPAMAGAIVRGGRAPVCAVVGVRRHRDRTKVTLDDTFPLGSCTQTMTATLVQILVDRGRLSWDDTLPDIFPHVAPTMHQAYQGVTLLDLAVHRGGLPGRDATWPAGMTERDARALRGSPAEQRQVCVSKILSQAPAVEPGTRDLPSDAGYAVLGAACEQATGVAYEALMRIYLFEPLGLRRVGFGMPGRPDGVGQPWPHRVEVGGLVPVAPGPEVGPPAAIAPAVGVHASVEDWSRFVQAHLDGAAGRDTPLAVEDWKRLHTPPENAAYAPGWHVMRRSWAGGRVLSQAAGSPLYGAEAWLAPKADAAAVVATNAGGRRGERACREAARSLMKAAL